MTPSERALFWAYRVQCPRCRVASQKRCEGQVYDSYVCRERLVAGRKARFPETLPLPFKEEKPGT